MTAHHKDGCWFALGWILILLTEAALYGAFGYSLWLWGKTVTLEQWIIAGLFFALLLSLWLNAIQGEESKSLRRELRVERSKNDSVSVMEGAD